MMIAEIQWGRSFPRLESIEQGTVRAGLEKLLGDIEISWGAEAWPDFEWKKRT